MQLFCFFLFCAWGCAYLGLQMKAIKPHLALLMSSSHRLFTICCPHTCITAWTDSSLLDLFTTSHSPSHSGLCQFKITLFAPQQWAHQTLSSFGFPTFPYSSCRHSSLSVWPIMSNNISTFVLGLKSAYEGEHMIFGLLSLGNFT
jgi:hypothetical protein